tara:strand:+ start:1249 stop:1425 length:177 start_codon:yes stop_codon:yes gene_type:complete
MKKSELRKIIKEEILKENSPGFEGTANMRELEKFLQELVNEGVIHIDVKEHILHLIKK